METAVNVLSSKIKICINTAGEFVSGLKTPTMRINFF